MSATDEFLKGQGIPIDLPRAESELTNLWGPAAQRVGGPELEHPTVTRVVLANLVVYGPTACLEPVVARYPCRTILLLEDPAAAARGSIYAEVSAACHLPAPGQPQVCSERIALFAPPERIDLFPGAVRSLLEPDLPTFLWWHGDLRGREDLYRSLAADASRALLELEDPGTPSEVLAKALSEKAQPFVHDRAWFGITPWREVIALEFDPPHQRWFEGIDEVEIVALTDREGLPRGACWLAGWLIAQLGWTDLRPSGNKGPGSWSYECRNAGKPVSIRIRSRVQADATPPQLASVTLRVSSGKEPMTMTWSRSDRKCPEICLTRTLACGTELKRTLLAEEFGGPGRMIAALESSRDDPPFRNATPHALAILAASE